MIGTPDYTSLGRPSVAHARVYATLEEITRSEKVIVFKKKRRKGYQKNAGHKQELNVVKINKIEHNIDSSFLEQNPQHIKALVEKNLQTRIKMF